MAAVVLESAFGSQYQDTPSSYEFPTRYLRHFASIHYGSPMSAVIYEPRGDNGRGQMAYVGIAIISQPPVETQSRSRNGERLWQVTFDGPDVSFDQPVRREVLGAPVEAWLRDLPRGRTRNVATLGRAVRPLSDEDLEQILLLGNAHVLGGSSYPVLNEHADPLTQVRERNLHLVSSIQRDARFRQDVLAAYGDRCSVSGFSLGGISPMRSSGLLEAAHIRPAGHSGPDVVRNGLPLTATLHRLFDVGLFTVTYEGGKPVIRTSPHLKPTMISVPDRGFELPLSDGLQVLTPSRTADWPSPYQLAYHQRHIFRAK
jgi:putative restriction endonuclease